VHFASRLLSYKHKQKLQIAYLTSCHNSNLGNKLKTIEAENPEKVKKQLASLNSEFTGSYKKFTLIENLRLFFCRGWDCS